MKRNMLMVVFVLLLLAALFAMGNRKPEMMAPPMSY